MPAGPGSGLWRLSGDVQREWFAPISVHPRCHAKSGLVNHERTDAGSGRRETPSPAEEKDRGTKGGPRRRRARAAGLIRSLDAWGKHCSERRGNIGTAAGSPSRPSGAGARGEGGRGVAEIERRALPCS